MSNTTVIAFSLIGGSGTFLNAIYYTARAYRSKTGPMISANKYMPDYSGHFEMDMLPVFVNLITTIQYIGETLETCENRIGFFNQYRYGSYLITCPLMVYETVHTIGAPYATTMFSLTLITIMTAIFADLAPYASQRWTWFGFGCTLNVMFCVMLLKVVKHAHRLNDGLCSDKQMKDSIKQLGYDSDTFPKGIMRLRTPMDEKRIFIDGAFALIFFLWPIFPIMFVLEHMGCVDRNMTQIVFALTDLIIKTSHSFCLDQYKQGLRHTVFSYGFLDTSILYELHIWDTTTDVYTQLKALSRSMYGDLLVGKKGQLTDIESAGIDYQSMLTANRLNRKVDQFEEESGGEPKSPTLIRRMSSPKVGFAKSTSFRVAPEPESDPDKQSELRTPHPTTDTFNQYKQSPNQQNRHIVQRSREQYPPRNEIGTGPVYQQQPVHNSRYQYPPINEMTQGPRNEMYQYTDQCPASNYNQTPISTQHSIQNSIMVNHQPSNTVSNNQQQQNYVSNNQPPPIVSNNQQQNYVSNAQPPPIISNNQQQQNYVSNNQPPPIISNNQQQQNYVSNNQPPPIISNNQQQQHNYVSNNQQPPPIVSNAQPQHIVSNNQQPPPIVSNIPQSINKPYQHTSVEAFVWH